MKTLFKLEHADKEPSSWFMQIIGKDPVNKPYVSIGDDVQSFYIADKDLERFAVNILKALNSKHLNK